MDEKDATTYAKAIAFLRAARPTLDKARDAVHYISIARGYYGVPSWKMWIVSIFATVALIASIIVAIKLPVLTWQYRILAITTSAILSTPFMFRLNLQKNALFVHYIGVYSTFLGVLAGGYYLYLFRTRPYGMMFVGLMMARFIYNMIPICRVALSKHDKSSFLMKVTVVIAVLSSSIRFAAILAAVVGGIFPVISYGWFVFGIDVIHIIWKEFGVKGTSVIASTTSNFVSANASAMMVLTAILLFSK
jgi:hypothetical protein